MSRPCTDLVEVDQVARATGLSSSSRGSPDPGSGDAAIGFQPASLHWREETAAYDFCRSLIFMVQVYVRSAVVLNEN